MDVHLLTERTETFEKGVSVASVKMAKGLEFDEVVVLDADELHRGRPSRFLAE